MEKIQPLNNHVLVKVKEEELKTDSGLIIPEVAGSDKNEGYVEAVAPDVPKEISVGDKVIFKDNPAIEVGHEDKSRLLLVEYTNIVAKVVEVEKI
ncbi:MAG: co-chaperone GroES [Candidatus Neomarinimicrobiota bacterium]|nr:co-chaperone GroES [Candidatus Neomarinimicrobiota bacterium]MBO8152467.1 co-chaperone GroES [Candidatus Neomarinimicrobiota bacterium]RKY46597.1 MAG: co-chaperone GroES [Candidatus Neomarinimicrobiota bacterium]RKY53208.1 MAG: co-chaperone GroES [Candidatus Neomarinimicrobiota bacterium]